MKMKGANCDYTPRCRLPVVQRAPLTSPL